MKFLEKGIADESSGYVFRYLPATLNASLFASLRLSLETPVSALWTSFEVAQVRSDYQRLIAQPSPGKNKQCMFKLGDLEAGGQTFDELYRKSAH
jgi:hypothetical protein